MANHDEPVRKIVKALYLLLEKYHRLYGLEVYSFSHGSFGPGYFGFQVAAQRCWWGADLRNANYQSNHLDAGLYGPLVGYWYMPSVPAWAAGDQLELSNWEHKRTIEIVNWFEKNMGFRALFEGNKRYIDEWRERYSVEAAEKYLLMMNLAGLLASRQNTFPRTPSQSFSAYDPEAPKKSAAIMRQLQLDPDYEPCCAFGAGDVFIGRNGKALANNRAIDVWELHVAGVSRSQIVHKLLHQGD